MIKQSSPVLNCYIHEGHGHFIGSCVIVIARTRRAATKLIRAKLDACGLADDPVKIKTVVMVKSGVVVHVDDGDY